MKARRHIVFVTGTRAELGLMLRTLRAIDAHPKLKLSVVATGMHLDERSGGKLSALRAAKISPAAVVEWARRDDPSGVAEEMGRACGQMAVIFRRIGADVALVVGDRVEAFAAAAAAQVSRVPVAHVHGGDRAEGQVDDSLRHAITKLSQLHLAATSASARRILKLGEDPKGVHVVGAPGVEGIAREAASKAEIRRLFPEVARSALVLLHPTSPDAKVEMKRAAELLAAIEAAGIASAIILGPNNDPGAEGIWAAWKGRQPISDLPRPTFLGLLRDCRLLAGNSSAGIIEAASLGTHVLNVGPRQEGRERGRNVISTGYDKASILRGLRNLLRHSGKCAAENPYEMPGTARRIAALLGGDDLSRPARPKLITY